ncbi:hypothetical protein MBEHAL_0008 [Halarchaeum acidiphilum MH1-52-1]|uniref:Uncharacterized protein n=1 Tax=Halarchaeum acidiphilum MH1-52-1 TaxID=1261545 RepID=U3A909_9EURY|nr:hypothetical protein MBEHAL_0008 [Halarchaeum acidiphilum MH1-52-1]
MVVEVVFEHVVDGGLAGRHRELVPSERAGVRARLPDVEGLVVDDDCERETAADGLRERDGVRRDVRVLERVRLAGAPEAGLDLVDDHRNVALAGDATDLARPLVRGGHRTALALHEFDEEARGVAEAAAGIVEEALDVARGPRPVVVARVAERAPVSVGIGEVVHAGHEGRQLVLGVRVAHHRQRAVRHPVVRAAEREDVVVPGRGLHELQRGLDGVRAGRATELHLRGLGEVVREARHERVDEALLRRRRDVERVDRPVVFERRLHRLVHDGVVVPERERARAREAVVVRVPVHVGQLDAFRFADGEREVARIGAGARLARRLLLQ